MTEKQKEILETAREMFAEKGYVETSMRDLALQLNIKAASLYSHFKSKEEILMIICNEIYNLMRENMSIINRTTADLEEKFKLYIKIHITTLVNNSTSFQIYVKYWPLVDSSAVGKYSVMNMEYFEFIKSIVYGNFPKLKDQDFYIPNSTALFIIDMLNNVPKLINPLNPDIDRVVEDIQKRLLYGYKSEK